MAAGHRAAARSVLDGHEHAGTLQQIETDRTEMDANTVLALGLGVTPPWRLVGQGLDTSKQPHELCTLRSPPTAAACSPARCAASLARRTTSPSSPGAT